MSKSTSRHQFFPWQSYKKVGVKQKWRQEEACSCR